MSDVFKFDFWNTNVTTSNSFLKAAFIWYSIVHLFLALLNNFVENVSLVNINTDLKFFFQVSCFFQQEEIWNIFL